MRKGIRFHILLPAAETVLAGLFGGIGLWQRNQILGRPFLGDQTLRESTARFHVWPWPYKFAAISNMPAFLAGGLVSLPINALWPELPEDVFLESIDLLIRQDHAWVPSAPEQSLYLRPFMFATDVGLGVHAGSDVTFLLRSYCHRPPGRRAALRSKVRPADTCF